MTNRLWALLPACVLASLVGAPVHAEELLPADRPIEEAIDHYVDVRLKKEKVTPAPAADEELVRRLTLDLAGRIPTPAEVRDYQASKDPAKRAKLIARLMDSPEYVRHSATEFDALLRGESEKAPSLRKYLLTAVEENRPWDQTFAELMGVKPAADRPEAFVLGRLKDPDELTRDVSSIFFGLNVTCAQCHRHPYVSSITQAYFWGMKQFFSRSIDFNGQLLERQYAQTAFEGKDGKVRQAKLMFLSGTVIEEPAVKVPDEKKATQEESKRIDDLRKSYAKEKKLPDRPAFSYREQLVKVALKPGEQERFAQAIVNRLWHRFHGHGLVMRLDQMHPKNPASHPDLLRWLARDLIEHKYDLRRLVRGLVSSVVYARSSRWDQKGAPPAPELFAVARVRLLTPMQYGVSQLIVADPASLPSTKDRAAFVKQYEKLEGEALKLFGRVIARPRDAMELDVAEALLLSNDVGLLKAQGGKLVAQLAGMDERSKQVEAAVWAVLSRPPTKEEADLLSRYLQREESLIPEITPKERKRREEERAAILKARGRAAQLEKEIAALKAPKDRERRAKLQAELAEVRKAADRDLPAVSPFASPREEALHQMVWALLNSPEFRFNH